MKIRLGLALSLPLFLSASHLALAAATQEEASRITAVFQSYLGTDSGVVKVEPQGDDYKVTLDIAPLANKTAAAGATVSMSPVNLTLTSAGEGKWSVSQDGPLEFSMKAGAVLATNMKIESYSWKGTFDEKLATFEQASGAIKNITFVENINDPSQGKTDLTVTIENVKLNQTATANSNGGADSILQYDFNGLSENVSSAGNTSANVPPLNFTLTAAEGAYSAATKGVKYKSIIDIVAFFVAHPSEELIKKDQASLKALLTVALPMFENIQGSSTFKAVTINSPVGVIGMDSLVIGADLNGFVSDGKFQESIAVSGLSVPPAVVPPWASTLVPKNMTFDFAGTGFDLAAPANAILNGADFTKSQPWAVGFENTLTTLLLPKGTVDISLNPTSISNDLYSIQAEGSMAAGPAAMPSGKAVIKAKGLDEILKAIQAAPPEAGVQSGVAMIVAAKGMGKAEADGSFIWNVESTPEGKVLINGIDPMKMQ
jgi:hypothetical protein